MEILRFITAGNVDDGKSTLIGRLLYDTSNLESDILDSVTDTTDETTSINLAHITDGLRAERTQGITIDVAYKYFTTTNRKYIIIDAPGHFQYTKNLVTGASGADMMIILIDAKNGITEQTRRHSLVASFLKIQQIVVAVNKMDIVGYDEWTFNNIKKDYLVIAEKLQLQNITFIPVSALQGDNILSVSSNMEWYQGPTLMQCLASSEPLAAVGKSLRFSVQYVMDALNEAYAGKVLSGNLGVTDIVCVGPDNYIATVKDIVHNSQSAFSAHAGQNIVLYLTSEGNSTRGNLISHFHARPIFSKYIEVLVCWLDADRPLQVGREYYLRINSSETVCVITEVLYKIDVNTFAQCMTDNLPQVNEFAKIKIETKELIVYDLFKDLHETGRGIIIDKETNYTSGAFIIEK